MSIGNFFKRVSGRETQELQQQLDDVTKELLKLQAETKKAEELREACKVAVSNAIKELGRLTVDRDRLHAEVNRLAIDRDHAMALKPDVSGMVERYGIKAGDLVVVRHTRSRGQLIDANSFGFGLSALDNLKKELVGLVGGPVMVIGCHADSTFDIERLDDEMKVKLLRELEAAVAKIDRDEVVLKKKLVTQDMLAAKASAARKLVTEDAPDSAKLEADLLRADGPNIFDDLAKAKIDKLLDDTK